MRVFNFFLRLAVVVGFCVALTVGVFQWARHGSLVPDAFAADARLLRDTACGFFSQFSAGSQVGGSIETTLPPPVGVDPLPARPPLPNTNVHRLRTLTREAATKARELGDKLTALNQEFQGGHAGAFQIPTSTPPEPVPPGPPAPPVEIVVVPISALPVPLRAVEPDFASLLHQERETRARLTKGGAL